MLPGKQDFSFAIYYISLLIGEVAFLIDCMSGQILISDPTFYLSGLGLDDLILRGHPKRAHDIRDGELSARVRVQLR